MEVIIQKSNKKDKKLQAVIDGKRTVQFGLKNASDFTIHKDPERKARYIARHQKNEDWRDPTTPGFYAKNILWNKKTIQDSVSDLNKRYKNIIFILKN